MESPKCVHGARAALLGLVALLSTQHVVAQQFPAKPVRIVISFPAGSANETTMRPVAEHMAGTLGQNVLLDARPGAAGLVAAQHVKSQPADGYTLLVASSTLIGASLRQNPQIDVRRDFTPVAPMSIAPLVIAVNSDIHANSLKELLDELRAKPGQLNYASYGNGSGAHVFMELLLHETRTNMIHVPYQGTAQGTLDTAVGRVQVTATILATARPYVASLGGTGKLRLLAVSTQDRSPLVPDLPGMKEVGLPQIDFPLWSGLLGPPAMARATVDIVARAANAATRDPKVVEVRTRLGLSSLSGGPEDLARTIAREYDGTARLIREAGLKID